MPVGAAFNVMVAVPTRSGSHLHTATVSNTIGNRTFLDHSRLNDNPDALVQVTQNWNPSGMGGVYNDHPIGVFYDALAGRWAITNMDGLAVPPGASFNVLLPPTDSAFWVHGSNAGNLGPGTTTLTHPLIDGEDSAILLTTAHLDFLGFGSSGYPLEATALAYDGVVGDWYLKNQWGPSWAANTWTNVYHPPIDLRTFVHQAGTGNLQYTVVRHPLLDGDTDAIFFVQPIMNPADGPLVSIFERVGVAWFSIAGEIVWTVHNEPLTFAINDEAAYNIYIPPPSAGAYKHTASPLEGSFTVLDHPALNGDPTAVVLVTHNISDSNGFLDKTLGVRYDHALARWVIETVDNSPIGDNTFNVLPVPEPGEGLLLIGGVGLLALLYGARCRRGLPQPGAPSPVAGESPAGTPMQ